MTDFADKEMARMVDQAQVTRYVLEAWKQHCGDKQTIVMCVSVEHACRIAYELQQQSIAAFTACGGTKYRSRAVKQFNEKLIQVLTTVRAIGYIEGGDYCIVDLKPKGNNWKPRIITAEGKVYTIDTTVTA